MKAKGVDGAQDHMDYTRRLGHAYQDCKMPDKALPLYELCLEVDKATFGLGAWSTKSTIGHLADCYRKCKRFDKLISLYEVLSEFEKAKFARGDEPALNAMSILADCYKDAKMPEKALAVLQERRKLELNIWGRTSVTRELALAFLEAKKTGDAMVVFNEYRDENRAIYATALSGMALDLLRHEQFEAVEPFLCECLEIRKKTEPTMCSTFNAKAMLGVSLVGQKKYKDAEPLLKEGYEGMKQREKTMPPAALPRLTEALERLVQLYEATGNAAEAERYRKELAERKAAQDNAYVPDLPGCVAVTRTRARVKPLIREAFHLHIEDMRERGDLIPKPTAASEFVEFQPA